MSGFPQVPRVTSVELFVTGTWVYITSDVYARDGVVITRGRRDEQSSSAPSSCRLTINNRSGNYSPRNPVGIWYGSIGRNTPIRVSVQLANDTFGRSVTNQWGTADTGQTYTLTGTGGTVTNSAWSVSGGLGLISLNVTNSTRMSILNSPSVRDVDLSASVSIPVTDITGTGANGGVQPINFILRWQSSTSYIYAGVHIATDESITVGIFHADGTVLAPFTTVTGLTHSSAQSLSFRAQADGQTFRAKVWATTSGEPYEWSVTANSALIMSAGLVGVFAWINSGNTNTRPIVFSFDNFTVRVPRFAGEVAAWPPRWDVSGNDTYVLIEGSGITRRLGQGAKPLRSAIRRHHDQLTTQPVAYWPGEDLASSADQLTPSIGSPPLIPFMVLDPGTPSSLRSHLLELSTYTGFVASAPLAQLGPDLFADATPDPQYAGVAMQAFTPIQSYTPTGQTGFRFLCHIPPETPGTPAPAGSFWLLLFSTTALTGNPITWEITYETGGALAFRGRDSTGIVVDSGTALYGTPIRGRDVVMAVDLTNTGANVAWRFVVLDAGAPFGLQTSGTLNSYTVGVVTLASFGYGQGFAHTAIGHVSIRTESLVSLDISAALGGYNGESAGSRIQRLCAEEGVPFSYRGDLDVTTAMGPQGVGSGGTSAQSLTAAPASQTLLGFLNECAAADTGTLYEPRGDVGVAYRTRSDVYNQVPQLDLDYSAGQVAPPLEPVDDDQLTRNNIIVTRANAGSAEAELTTGRMSTRDPSLGGVGEYDTQYTLNVETDDQLPDLAAWFLTLGTVDEARYPTVTVNLANSNVVTAGLESDALAVDIDDRLTISNPKPGQAPDQISQLVRGYTETLNVFEHTITFNCSPETPYEIAQIDSNPQYKIDTDTSTLTVGGNSVVGAFSVSNVNEPWTTDPTQMPIQIMVAGEQMSVTAISGTGSPQTFTVTRSVNGVVKTQAAGASVQLVRLTRPIIGL